MAFRSDPSIRAGQVAQLPNGMRLHFASAGDPSAPLVILLHGYPEFWYAWRRLMPALAGTHFVVAPDMRGYNLSDKPDDVSDYQMPFLVSDIAQLIQYFDHRKASVIAHDWGGIVTWALAHSRPDLLNAAMIINAPHPVPFSRLLANNAKQQQASRYINKLRAPGSEQWLLSENCAGFARAFHAPGRDEWFDDSIAAQYRSAWTQPGAATGMVNYYRAWPLYPPQGRDTGAAGLALEPADHHVSVPIRLFWAMQDAALPPENLDGLEDLIDDLVVERIEDATHWVVHEQPVLIEQRARSFLQEFTVD
jgi:pimeloyl-ACP methyl ester carboxylesterase